MPEKLALPSGGLTSNSVIFFCKVSYEEQAYIVDVIILVLIFSTYESRHEIWISYVGFVWV